MTNSTRQFIIILAAGVTALLVLAAAILFGTGLYQGTVSVPEHVQTQIWTGIVALIVVATGAVTSYINARNIERIRADADRNATYIQEAQAREFALNRETTKRSAGETQNKVQELIVDVHNGLKKDFGEAAAAIVKDDAAQTARNLAASEHGTRRQADIETNAAAIAALAQKLDLLLLAAGPVGPVAREPQVPSPPPPDPALQASVDEIVEHTRETAENTKPEEPEGSAV